MFKLFNGILLGFVIYTAFLLLLTLYSDTSTIEWETLIAGMMALLGGLLAVFYTMLSENRKRKNDAHHIKSTIPISCVEILEYLKAHIEYFYFKDKNKPEPPTDAMQRIAELIQFSQGNVQENLYKICCQYQVIQSRLSEKEKTVSDDRARKSLDLLIFAHYLYALLSYTRGVSNRHENAKEFMHLIVMTPGDLFKTYKNIVGLLKYKSREYANLLDYISNIESNTLNEKSNYDFSLKE